MSDTSEVYAKPGPVKYVLMFILFRLRVVRLAQLFGMGYGFLWLVGAYGPVAAYGIYAAAVAVLCGVGSVLLMTSELGRLTWKNTVAGLLVPWGWWMVRGTNLIPAAAASWVGWMLVAVATHLVTSGKWAGGAGEGAGWVAMVCMGLVWAIHAFTLTFFLTAMAKQRGNPRGQWTITRLLALVVGLLVASIGLWVAGLYWTAVVVGVFPFAIVGAFYGVFIAIILMAGKNLRWN